MIIGITGGSGSGKTTLLELLRKQGGLVLDCDAVYHELLRTDRVLLNTIEKHFPGTVENGVLLRKKLGNIVFSDECALQELNSITHCAVKAAVVEKLQNHPPLAAIDAIGLFEGNLAEICDVTVGVLAPEQDRIARLMERDGISEAYARKRIHAQHPDEWYQNRCDEILINDTDLSTFVGKCLAFFSRYDIIKP